MKIPAWFLYAGGAAALLWFLAKRAPAGISDRLPMPPQPVPPGVDTISWDQFKSHCVQNGVLMGKQCAVGPDSISDFSGRVIRWESNGTVSVLRGDGTWERNVDV